MIKDPVVIRKDGIRVLVFLVGDEKPIRVLIARNTVFSREEIQRIKKHLEETSTVGQLVSSTDFVEFREIPEFKPRQDDEPYEFVDLHDRSRQPTKRPLGLVNLGDKSMLAIEDWLVHHTAMTGDITNTVFMCAVSYTADHASTAIDKTRLLLRRLEEEIQIKEEKTL